MNRIRQSFDGLKNIVTNVIAYVAGANDDPNSSLSSGEIVECDSDCSQCCSENRSISMAEASSSKRSAVQALVEDLQSSGQKSSKRRKHNAEESKEDKENEAISINRSKSNISEINKEASKRGKRRVLNLFIASNISNTAQVVVVHRKRKLHDISGGVLNRS